jgi:hypothetical protein
VPVVGEASFCGVLAHRRDSNSVVQVKVADLYGLEKAAHNSLLWAVMANVPEWLEWDRHCGVFKKGTQSPIPIRKSGSSVVGRQDSALEPYKLFCPIENKARVVPYRTRYRVHREPQSLRVW